MASVLIVGCGDLGSGLANELVAAGHDVFGVRRTGKTFPKNVHGITGDVLNLKDDALPEVDMIFLIMTPQDRTEEGYQQAYFLPAKRLLARYKSLVQPPMLFFVSSTSVFGQNSGEFLTEQDLPLPTSSTAKVLLATEQLLKDNLPTTSIRFSGIYGANRFRLIEEIEKQKEWAQNQWTNRIHRDDCVRVLAFLAQYHFTHSDPVQHQPILDATYIATDNAPVSIWEVKLWIAATLDLPPNLPMATSAFLPMSGKRLSNARLRELGFGFTYPSYIEGYSELIRSYASIGKTGINKSQ